MHHTHHLRVWSRVLKIMQKKNRSKKWIKYAISIKLRLLLCQSLSVCLYMWTSVCLSVYLLVAQNFSIIVYFSLFYFIVERKNKIFRYLAFMCVSHSRMLSVCVCVSLSVWLCFLSICIEYAYNSDCHTGSYSIACGSTKLVLPISYELVWNSMQQHIKRDTDF